MQKKIKYYGWDYKGKQRYRTEKTIVGEIIRESEKQIVIKDSISGTISTINKYKIISIKKV